METVAPGVRVLGVSCVTPALALAAENTTVKLSFFDAPWVATPPVQQVFLYKFGGGDEFGAVVKRLKESLAASLALYLPLAGKLRYIEETRDLVLDCSQPGVAFFEAEAIAGCMEVPRFADNVSVSVATEVAGLLPEHDVQVLPAPVLAVQATLLGAGLALGVSVHHAVVDGHAFGLFMDAWSSISRRGLSAAATELALAPPYYTRPEAIISHDLVHHVVNKVAPNLSVVQARNTTTMDDGCSPHSRRLMGQRHRTFIFGKDDIQRMKRRIDGLSSSSTTHATAAAAAAAKKKPVSTFVALSALSWIAFVQAKGLTAGQDTQLLFQVDLRGRLRPPVSAGYLGNCVRGCIASADAGELLGEAGLIHAMRAIQAAVREVVAAPVAGMETWIQRIMVLPVERQVCVGGSPLFRVFQTAHFGFGMPDSVVPVSMPGSPLFSSSMAGHGGRVALSAGKRDGQVHVSVSFDDPALMDTFNSHIKRTLLIRSKF